MDVEITPVYKEYSYTDEKKASTATEKQQRKR